MTTRALRRWYRSQAEQFGSFAALTADLHVVMGMPLPSHQTLRNFCAGMRVQPRIENVLRAYATKRGLLRQAS